MATADPTDTGELTREQRAGRDRGDGVDDMQRTALNEYVPVARRPAQLVGRRVA